MNLRSGLGFLIGGTLVAIPLWRVARDRDLRDSGVEATVLRVEAPAANSKEAPAVILADPGGRELRCSGWGIAVGDAMRYDPTDPERCRAAAQIGWPGPEEWLVLGGGLLVLFVGAVAQVTGRDVGRGGRRMAMLV